MKKTNGNPKDDLGFMKVCLRFKPPAAEIYWALVHGNGAEKYGEFNWRERDVKYTVYIEAIDRHRLLLSCGQDTDEESGLPHEAHIMACAAILIDARAAGALIDDRPMFGEGAVELMRKFTKSSYGKKMQKTKRTPVMTIGEFKALATAHARAIVKAYETRRPHYDKSASRSKW